MVLSNNKAGHPFRFGKKSKVAAADEMIEKILNYRDVGSFIHMHPLKYGITTIPTHPPPLSHCFVEVNTFYPFSVVGE